MWIEMWRQCKSCCCLVIMLDDHGAATVARKVYGIPESYWAIQNSKNWSVPTYKTHFKVLQQCWKEHSDRSHLDANIAVKKMYCSIVGESNKLLVQAATLEPQPHFLTPLSM